MQYDFTLLAGEAKQYEVKGRFIKYKSGVGMIRVRMSKGGYVDLLPGQGVNNVDYENFIITDKSGAANTGVVLAGNYDFRDDRITGTVDVVDGGKSRTISGQAFIGGASCGSNAGLQACTQLWNQAGSGKRLIVSSAVLLSLNTGGLQQLRLSTVKLATNETAPVPNSKFSAGAASTAAIMCHENKVMSDPLIIGAVVQPNITFQLSLREPIVILPGAGLTVCTSLVNQDLVTYFEFTEELI